MKNYELLLYKECECCGNEEEGEIIEICEGCCNKFMGGDNLGLSFSRAELISEGEDDDLTCGVCGKSMLGDKL